MFSLAQKLAGMAIILVMLLLALGVYVKARERAAYIRGQDELQQAVEKRNHEAATHAQEARNEIDKCFDAGRDWDQSRGVCLPKR